MRKLFIPILFAAAPALAGPDPAPPCAVTILRAPADVRAQVEGWLASEPHCSVALEVRIIPTDGGFYLMARDDQGRIHERIVPDAKSAAVLIASWAADDRLDEQATVEDPVTAAPAAAAAAEPPAAAPAPVELHAELGPTRVAGGPGVLPARALPDGRADHGWLSVYGLVQPGGDGLRAEVDLWRRRGWSLGVAASISRQQQMNESVDSYDELAYSGLGILDIKAMAYGAYTFHLGDSWHVRTAIGAGVVLTAGTLTGVAAGENYTGEPGNGTSTAWAALPTADASILIGVDLGGGWALDAGPLLSVFMQTLQIAVPDSAVSGGDMMIGIDREIEIAFIGGLRHRL